MLRAEVLETMWYGCVTWSPCLWHYDTLRRAHPSFLTRYIGWQKNNPTDHPISYLGILMEMGSESIEVIFLSSRILFAGFVSRIVDTKLPKCVMFGELMENTGYVEVSPGRPRSFRYERRQVNGCSPGRGGIA